MGAGRPSLAEGLVWLGRPDLAVVAPTCACGARGACGGWALLPAIPAGLIQPVAWLLSVKHA
jgi:hypothetical protein